MRLRQTFPVARKMYYLKLNATGSGLLSNLPCVRPASKTSLTPRQARSAARWWGLTRGFRHRRGGGSRRFKRKQTVDASRMDLWLMSSSDKMGGGGDTASKDRTGIGEE